MKGALLLVFCLLFSQQCSASPVEKNTDSSEVAVVQRTLGLESRALILKWKNYTLDAHISDEGSMFTAFLRKAELGYAPVLMFDTSRSQGAVSLDDLPPDIREEARIALEMIDAALATDDGSAIASPDFRYSLRQISSGYFELRDSSPASEVQLLNSVSFEGSERINYVKYQCPSGSVGLRHSGTKNTVDIEQYSPYLKVEMNLSTEPASAKAVDANSGLPDQSAALGAARRLVGLTKELASSEFLDLSVDGLKAVLALSDALNRTSTFGEYELLEDDTPAPYMKLASANPIEYAKANQHVDSVEIEPSFESLNPDYPVTELKWDDYSATVYCDAASDFATVSIKRSGSVPITIYSSYVSEKFEPLDLRVLPADARDLVSAAVAMADAALKVEGPTTVADRRTREVLEQLSERKFSLNPMSGISRISFSYERAFNAKERNLATRYYDSTFNYSLRASPDAVKVSAYNKSNYQRSEIEIRDGYNTATAETRFTERMPPESEILALARQAAGRALKFAQSEHADPPPEVIELLQRVKDTLDGIGHFDSYGSMETGR